MCFYMLLCIEVVCTVQAQPHLHSLWGGVLSLLGKEASWQQLHIPAP